jgi:hypothetical protein
MMAESRGAAKAAPLLFWSMMRAILGGWARLEQAAIFIARAFEAQQCCARTKSR